MTVAKVLQPPEWIDSGAEIKNGLDLLGLRLPVQFIGGSLLDGITSVTPSIRYLALRAWLIRQYGQSGQPDSMELFSRFAARIESAVVLGNLLQDMSVGGLIGPDEAKKRIDAGSDQVEISALVVTPASTIYTGPSDQLNITRPRKDKVPGLVDVRGVPLAESVNKKLSLIPVVDHLLTHRDIERVPVEDLKELGAAMRIDQVPDDECELLLVALIPAQPLRGEHARIGTYAGLLTLASKLKARPSEYDFFETVCAGVHFEEPLLDHVADGWANYCVRDAIAITLEAVLAAVVGEISSDEDRGLFGIDRNAVVSALMERVGEHDSALQDLELLDRGESITQLRFREFEDRMRSRILSDDGGKSGFCRWSGKLIEPLLYKRALKSGAGALSLGLVAWLMASIRVGGAVAKNAEEGGKLSYQGWRRVGLLDVILPELDRFRRENRPVREVVSEFAYRAVQQHLQIAWSRLQVDLQRDVALLTAEGNKWFSRGKRFNAGRTKSRIPEALSWLHQLKLIDADGLTADGSLVLGRAMKVLAEGATP